MSTRVPIAAAERVANTLDKHGLRREAVIVRGLCADYRDERRFGRETVAKLAEAQAALDAQFKAEKSKSEQKLPVHSVAPARQGGEAPLLSSSKQPAALAKPSEGGEPVQSTPAKEPSAPERRVAAPPSAVSNPAGGGAILPRAETTKPKFRDWITQRKEEIADASAYLKARNIVVSVSNPHAEIKMFRLSDRGGTHFHESVLDAARELGWEGLV